MTDFVDDFYNNSFNKLLSKPDSQDTNLNIISDIVKEYPDMLKIVIYHESYNMPQYGKNPKNKHLKKQSAKADSIQRSVRRSRTTINDIMLSNKFDYWCTFTFSPKVVDRQNIARCKLKMSLWLHRQRTHSPNLLYLIVPELHETGEVHFHALLKNFNGRLKDSKKRTKHNQVIYNITGYRSGWTTAVKLDGNTEAISGYIQKYITKDMIKLDSKKRFWCSQSLIRPKTTVNGVGFFGLQKIIQSYPPTYINGSYEIQHHAKLPTPLTPQSQVSFL